MTTSPNSGLALIDKPYGWTSHDVVAKMRRLAQTKKVGHAGTLDPMATGLLLVGVGAATRLLTYLVGLNKHYLATVRLGQETVTDDAEGEIVRSHSTADVSRLEVEDALVSFRGQIEQIPSAVSAVKVNGQRAYARVRAGESVDLKPRSITISRLTIEDAERRDAPDGILVFDLQVDVECSTGTYIRALARDIGAALGVGGHVTRLRRVDVGPFNVADAVALADLIAATENGQQVPLLGMGEVASSIFETYHVTAAQVVDLRQGRHLTGLPALGDGTDFGAALDENGELVAVVRADDKSVRPVTVFPPSP